MKKKVLLGMSGGVDSSVAAAILLEQGYEVTGLTMRLADAPQFDKAVNDAAGVAKKLGISHLTVNFSGLFREHVVNYFINEYRLGRTPNPCVVCNRLIKFGAIMDEADRLGMDYIATGHYANIVCPGKSDRYLLSRSDADKKDQTYFLYKMSQKQLARTLMPLGGFSKEQIREKARGIGLVTADKKDSQEICFIPDNNYGEYIKRNINVSVNEGEFVDVEGRVFGKHKGLINYTVGQRKGLGIAFGRPMYVVALDTENNRVVLGDNEDLFKSSLIAGELNWIMYSGIGDQLRVEAKIRSTALPSPAFVEPIDGLRVKVVFDRPQRAITPGQSVVFYDGNYVVGGGVILS